MYILPFLPRAAPCYSSFVLPLEYADMFKEWMDRLLQENGASTIDALTPDMIAAAIEETKGAISDENIWANGAGSQEDAAMHRVNIARLTEWNAYLETLMPNMHRLQLVLGIYEDPDELPMCVTFFVPRFVDIGYHLVGWCL